jgi:hypothetical protein
VSAEINLHTLCRVCLSGQGSVMLLSYGTQKSVSYEIQPTSDQECAIMY